MHTQRVIEAAELADMLAAVFAYNGLTAVDVAFDVSGGGLRAIVTCENEPLRVRDSPESEMDNMSEDMLRRMRDRAKFG